MLTSCAPVVAVLVKKPGVGGGGVYAPVNEREIGEVAFRVRGQFEAVWLDGRNEGQRLMYEACKGDYRVESEDSDSSRIGPWRVARFTCIDGPPKTDRERITERLHVATGCPREYIFVEADGQASVCQVRYVCGAGDAGIECGLER